MRVVMGERFVDELEVDRAARRGAGRAVFREQRVVAAARADRLAHAAREQDERDAPSGSETTRRTLVSRWLHDPRINRFTYRINGIEFISKLGFSQCSVGSNILSWLDC